MQSDRQGSAAGRGSAGPNSAGARSAGPGSAGPRSPGQGSAEPRSAGHESSAGREEDEEATPPSPPPRRSKRAAAGRPKASDQQGTDRQDCRAKGILSWEYPLQASTCIGVFRIHFESEELTQFIGLIKGTVA